MKKGYKIGIVFFLLIIATLITHLVYEEWKYQKEMEEEFMEMKPPEYEKAENYKIVETAEGKRVVNDNVGLSFSVPDGWNVEIVDKEYAQEVILSSPDMETHNILPFKGCAFAIVVEHYIQSFPGHRRRPQFIERWIKGEEEILEVQEIITFRNKKALKTTIKTDEGDKISVEYPRNNRIFLFATLIIPKEEVRCGDEFNNLLKSVLID